MHALTHDQFAGWRIKSVSVNGDLGHYAELAGALGIGTFARELLAKMLGRRKEARDDKRAEFDAEMANHELAFREAKFLIENNSADKKAMEDRMSRLQEQMDSADERSREREHRLQVEIDTLRARLRSVEDELAAERVEKAGLQAQIAQQSRSTAFFLQSNASPTMTKTAEAMKRADDNAIPMVLMAPFEAEMTKLDELGDAE